jgi:tRNA A-37 threonylcarbamoyl transferase component Bud32
MGFSVLPEEFLELRRPGLWVWVRKGFSFLMDDAGKWRDERAFCAPIEGIHRAGRGRMVRLSLGPTAEGTALVRHYHRGGVFRGLLRDFYWGRRRFLHEVRVSEWARRNGVPTAEVLALRMERRGLCLHRADLVTREIQGSEDLDCYMKSARARGERQNPRRRLVIQSVALLLQQMHGRGLYHADLNLKNILVQVTVDGVNSYVIDLDRARVIRPLGSRMRIRNLLRLYRSLDKKGYLRDLVQTRDIAAFVKSYCGTDRELLCACREVMRKDMWMLRAHRAGWRIARGLRKIEGGRNG